MARLVGGAKVMDAFDTYPKNNVDLSKFAQNNVDLPRFAQNLIMNFLIEQSSSYTDLLPSFSTINKTLHTWQVSQNNKTLHKYSNFNSY